MAEKELCKTPQKPKKHVKYEQKFKIEYRDEFKCISKSALVTLLHSVTCAVAMSTLIVVKMLTISPFFGPQNLPVFGFTGLAALI